MNMEDERGIDFSKMRFRKKNPPASRLQFETLANKIEHELSIMQAEIDKVSKEFKVLKKECKKPTKKTPAKK